VRDTRSVASDARDLPELDALRGVAIAAVSGLHVSFGFLLAAPVASFAVTAALVVHLLTAFGAPFFVALSLAGLTLGYERPLGVGADYRAFLVRRAWRVLPAYVFWTLLTLLRTDPASLARPGVVAQHLVRGSAAYHLYFVPLICIYYVVWPVLSHLAPAARRSQGTAIAIAVSGLAASLLAWHAASVGWLEQGVATLPLFWIGYATLGIAAAPALARRSALRTPPRPLLLIGVLTAIAAYAWVSHVRGLIGPAPDAATLALAVTIFQMPAMSYTLAAMGLAVALVGSSTRGTAWLQALGRSSYGVYLAHVLVLEVVVQRLLGHPRGADFASPAWAATMVATWVGCLALTYALVRALAVVPGLAIVAGERPRRRDDPAALTPRPHAP
jgi:peptidoglycan/LPS O-acetylase OafA/YrhL